MGHRVCSVQSGAIRSSVPRCFALKLFCTPLYQNAEQTFGTLCVLATYSFRLWRELRFSHPNPASGNCLAAATAAHEDFPPHVGDQGEHRWTPRLLWSAGRQDQGALVNSTAAVVVAALQ